MRQIKKQSKHRTGEGLWRGFAGWSVLTLTAMLAALLPLLYREVLHDLH